MKKAFLVILVIASVVFSAFAGGLHYGLESNVDYDFLISDVHYGDNAAVFTFKPYVYNDFFTVRLRAQWIPEADGAHGFDYLMDFDTTDFYTILDSSLKYVDEISVTSDIVKFVVGKGTRQFEVGYDFAKYHYNRAQLNIDAGVTKIELYSTDFEKFPLLGINDYNSCQYGDIKINLGLVGIEASVMRQGYYLEYTTDAFLGKNRIIPRLGAKLQFGLTNVGFFFTTDMAYDNADDSVRIKVFDRWVLEAVAEFKAGAFDITGKFYLDNRLQGYANLVFPNEALFGFRADANLALGDFLSLQLAGDLPLKLDGALRVVKYFDKTMESVSAKFEVGTWWKVGAEIAFRGLISQIDNGDDLMTIIKAAEPTITAGIYTVPLDVTASVKFTNTFGSDFVPEVSVGAVIRADNFLSNINK